jgi:hypothetical protein
MEAWLLEVRLRSVLLWVLSGALMFQDFTGDIAKLSELYLKVMKNIDLSICCFPCIFVIFFCCRPKVGHVRL